MVSMLRFEQKFRSEARIADELPSSAPFASAAGNFETKAPRRAEKKENSQKKTRKKMSNRTELTEAHKEEEQKKHRAIRGKKKNSEGNICN